MTTYSLAVLAKAYRGAERYEGTIAAEKSTKQFDELENRLLPGLDCFPGDTGPNRTIWLGGSKCSQAGARF